MYATVYNDCHHAEIIVIEEEIGRGSVNTQCIKYYEVSILRTNLLQVAKSHISGCGPAPVMLFRGENFCR